MFTASADINCFIILKLDAKTNLINANISVNEQQNGSTGHTGGGHFMHIYVTYTF